MSAPLQFHFDFISPYGYFASLAIEELAARHGRTVDWCPMLLGVAVMKVMGLKPLLETPLKGAYVRRDVLRTARRMEVELGRSLDAPVGSPLPPARAFCWVKKHHPDLQGPVAHVLYDAYWRRGCDLSTPEALHQVTWPGSITADEVVAAAGSEEAALLLRTSVDASLAAGVFGSPTIVVDGEPFWGADRLREVDAWMTHGGW